MRSCLPLLQIQPETQPLGAGETEEAEPEEELEEQ